MRALRCALLLLLQCVSSLPVSHTRLEYEDVKVIKCIVEVLADALSKPHSVPVSQQCLETLRTDDRLVTVLRHRNFLQELQDIAGEGAIESSKKGSEEHSDHAQDLHHPADQSMLMAVLTPGETLKERGAEEEQESQENDIITSHQEMNEEDEKGDLAVKKENSEEEKEADEEGADGAPGHKGVEEQEEEQDEEQEEEQDEQQEEEQEESVGKSGAGIGKQKHWSRSRELGHSRAYGQQEAPHHSKEAWKSPEEEELQMMAGRGPEEHRDPEEGSATKKAEDAEMESLAVMENELENMAQKLHELRHG